MKQTLKKITLIIFSLFSNVLSAQFIGTNPPFTISTVAQNTGVGIGNFPAFTSTNARFHVSNFFCAQPNGALNGFLFRTDGNSSVDNQWQLFTGSSLAFNSEKFKIFVPANSNRVVFQTSKLNSDMRFNTGGTTTRMIITDGVNGFIGIGNNFLIPNNRLDVDGGDIDVNMVTFGYKIADLYVMRRNSSGNGIYLGVGAGGAILANMNNTFTGFNAGNVNNGPSNTFTGYTSGVSNTVGDGNTFTGAFSGTGNTVGAANVCVGLNSGTANVTGNANLILGANANMGGTGLTALNNAIAIGRNATVMNSNQMILGQNNVNVGIGLSADPIGPLAKLDVFSNTNTANSLGIRSINTDVDGVAVKAVSNGAASGAYTRVAGWFSSPDAPAPLGQQVAIFVQEFEGVVNIGFPSPNATSFGGIGILNINGSGYAIGGTWQPSDSSLKKNIQPLEEGLDKIIHLQPITFEWDTVRDSLMAGTHAGFTAQGLKKVVPNIVREAGNTQAVSYTELIPYVVKGIQQQQLSIDSLRGGEAVPNGQVLISPANGSSGSFNGRGGSQLVWHSVSQGIVLYHAQIASDNSFSNIVFDMNGIGDTTATFNLCDTSSTTYYWRVSAKNETGTGAWSNVFSFTDTAKCFGVPIGRMSATSFATESDSRLKTNVTPMTNCLVKVTQLNGVNYTWLHNNPHYTFDNTNQIGFIAQDVQAVVPQVVSTDANGFLTIDYGRLVPVLVEAIKTLKAEVDSLKSNNARTVSNISKNVNAVDVELSDADVVVLNQNIPNPFAEQTTISYNIPKNATASQILFYDVNGRNIKTVDVTKKGKGQLNVYANDLTNGIYSYTLIVDGKIIDTKKMVKQQ